MGSVSGLECVQLCLMERWPELLEQTTDWIKQARLPMKVVCRCQTMGWGASMLFFS